jgi:hypothetical protein
MNTLLCFYFVNSKLITINPFNKKLKLKQNTNEDRRSIPLDISKNYMCFFSNDDTCKHKIIEGKAFGDPSFQSMNKKNFFSLKDCTKGRMMRKLLP